MSDSLLPHSPSLDEPLEMLEACHERIEAQLKTLERLLDYLPRHGADEQACQAVRNILRYFNQAGPNHHEDEEKNLFPMLTARATADEVAEVQLLVGSLVADHEQMSEALDALRPQLVSITEGLGAKLEEAPVRRLVALYRQHIVKENTTLLPLSRRLLLPLDLETLSRAMTTRRTQRVD